VVEGGTARKGKEAAMKAEKIAWWRLGGNHVILFLYPSRGIPVWARRWWEVGGGTVGVPWDAVGGV
jgi:hypothetical protein